MGVAWDMWDHRNSVLHNDTENFHHKRLVKAADRQIRREFKIGKLKLLMKHRHLLRNKLRLLKKELMEKQRWIDAVAGARLAWKDHMDSLPTYDAERRAIDSWFHTGTCRRPRRTSSEQTDSDNSDVTQEVETST